VRTLKTISLAAVFSAALALASANDREFQANSAPYGSREQGQTPGSEVPGPRSRGPMAGPGRGHGIWIGPHAGDWLRRYKNLPAQQQERALDNDSEFRRLDPEQQAKLRQRLREFRNLAPEKQQRILERMERFEHLTPEQQQQVRDLGARFRQLPEDRRQLMMQSFHRLRDASPEERQAMLQSEGFRSTFSSQEQELLRGMSELGFGPGHRPHNPNSEALRNPEPSPPAPK